MALKYLLTSRQVVLDGIHLIAGVHGEPPLIKVIRLFVVLLYLGLYVIDRADYTLPLTYHTRTGFLSLLHPSSLLENAPSLRLQPLPRTLPLPSFRPTRMWRSRALSPHLSLVGLAPTMTRLYRLRTLRRTRPQTSGTPASPRSHVADEELLLPIPLAQPHHIALLPHNRL